nr:M56 family metallopeptidase [Micromonospora carbonacea]
MTNWLLPWVFGDYDNAAIEAVNACQTAVYRDLMGISRAHGFWDVFRSDGPFHQRLDQLADCPRTGRSGAWPLIGVVSFWTIVIVALWWLPAWRIRRRRYERLGQVAGPHPPGADGRPRLLDALAQLQHTAGVPSAVTYLRDNLDPRCTALAFGRTGHRCVVLSAGLETLRHRDRAAFDAVVLHELAHVRNRDVDVGFLTVIAWRVAMPLVALTTLLSIARPWTNTGGTAGDKLLGAAVALQFLGSSAAVLLLGRSVLRSRELLADARVSHWASRDALIRALESHFPHSPRRPVLLWTHPSLARRISAMRDSRLLEATNFWVWFAVGLVTKTIIYGVATTSRDNAWGLSMVAAYAVGAGFVLVAFASEILRDPDPNRDHRDGRRVAVGLGLGLAIGFVLLDSTVISIVVMAQDAFALQLLLWIPVLCGAAWLAYRWLAVVAAAWAPVLAVLRRSWSRALGWTTLGMSIVPIYVGLTFLVSQLTQSIIGPLIDAEGVLSAPALLVELPLRFALSPYQRTGPLLLVLAALPLVADVLRGRTRNAPSAPRARSGLTPGLLHGFVWGLVAITLSPVVAVSLLGEGGGLTAFLAICGVVVVTQVACAAQLAHRLRHRPHPVGAAALGGLTVGLFWTAWTIFLSMLSSQASGAAVSLSALVQESWYPVPVGVALGAGVAYLTARLYQRQAGPDGAALVHPDLTAKVPDVPPGRPRRPRRLGLRYGLINAAAILVVSMYLSILVAIPVGLLLQVVCAIHVIRKPQRRYPVLAATLASVVTGVVGQAAVLMLIVATLLSSEVSNGVAFAVNGTLLLGCPLVVGTGVGSAVAGILHGIRSGRRLPPGPGPGPGVGNGRYGPGPGPGLVRSRR